jgi:hypothetical protein
LGLLGGIGGAFIGGKVANEGQEKQFQNQRIAQLQDVLIADYGTYLRTAEIVAADSTTLAKARTDEKKAADLAAFSAAEAEVHLVASAELWTAAQAVRESFETTEQSYRTAIDAFIERANQDVNSVAE